MPTFAQVGSRDPHDCHLDNLGRVSLAAVIVVNVVLCIGNFLTAGLVSSADFRHPPESTKRVAFRRHHASLQQARRRCFGGHCRMRVVHGQDGALQNSMAWIYLNGGAIVSLLLMYFVHKAESPRSGMLRSGM